ncbi:MAG: nucleotidyltransferase substrate binding protein [Deltaproteobacteria bacterium]|nr:nucleotidyltransferase substrate binding protein [Deltaproteobacteria bacterium]
MNPILDLSSSLNATETPRVSLDVYDERSDEGASRGEIKTSRAGVIKTFEFTYELRWKAIKKWIEINVNPASTDGATRRELFRIAAENKLSLDVDKWMDFDDDRNNTSRAYDEIVAAKIFFRRSSIFPFAKDCRLT